MEISSLRPEAHLDLQISLDHLEQIQDRCRDGLTLLLQGRITRDDYVVLLQQQVEAQRRWKSCHRKYFADPFGVAS